MVSSLSLVQEVVGSRLTFDKHFVNEFTEFSERHLRKTPISQLQLNGIPVCHSMYLDASQRIYHKMYSIFEIYLFKNALETFVYNLALHCCIGKCCPENLSAVTSEVIC